MLTTLRKIGNSRGVIIPAALLEQLQIMDDLEMTLEGGCLILRPVKPPRAGWFDGYCADGDVAPLSQLRDLASEQEDWEW